MSYKLNKPYTNIQRADFICEHQGLNYYEDSNAIYMLQPFEKVIDGEIKGSQTPEYIAEQEARAKEIKRAELLAEIEELEKSQTRAIREVALGKSVDFAMGKLQDLDNQIAGIRTQIAGL